MPKIKNIIIFLIIGAVFASIYFFYIRKPSESPAVLVSSGAPLLGNILPGTDDNLSVTQDFLNLLLSVKNIKLNDTIFSESAFTSLQDSSIILTPDGNEGRVNPFAPLGMDAVAPPASATPPIGSTGTGTGTGSTGAGTGSGTGSVGSGVLP